MTKCLRSFAPHNPVPISFLLTDGRGCVAILIESSRVSQSGVQRRVTCTLDTRKMALLLGVHGLCEEEKEISLNLQAVSLW